MDPDRYATHVLKGTHLADTQSPTYLPMTCVCDWTESERERLAFVDKLHAYYSVRLCVKIAPFLKMKIRDIFGS